MKVAKWGNSLAVRLPTKLVNQLGLKEGDDIQLVRNSDGALELSVDTSREEALEEIRRLRKPLPAGYIFNREELYERGEGSSTTEKKPGAAAD